jgi:uncharacterized protein
MTTPRSVTTTGQGSVRVVPDSAVVRVAVTHRAEGVAEAFAGVDSAAKVVGTVARDFTDASRVASTDLSVWPAHNNEGRQEGFEARHGLTISCKDLKAAGALLSALAEQVGNRLVVEGISLEVQDQESAITQAREAAFLDARQRATHLAELSDQNLGRVMAISESGFGHVGREAGGMACKAASDMAIEPGETSIGASVSVTWELAE